MLQHSLFLYVFINNTQLMVFFSIYITKLSSLLFLWTDFNQASKQSWFVRNISFLFLFRRKGKYPIGTDLTLYVKPADFEFSPSFTYQYDFSSHGCPSFVSLDIVIVQSYEWPNPTQGQVTDYRKVLYPLNLCLRVPLLPVHFCFSNLDTSVFGASRFLTTGDGLRSSPSLLRR